MISDPGRYPTGEVAVEDETTQGAPAIGLTAAAETSVRATLEQTESAEARGHRFSMAVLLGLATIILVWLTFKASGDASFALSDAFATVSLPTITVPAAPTVAVCAVLCLLAAIGLLVSFIPPKVRTVLNVLAGAAIIIGFLAWAAGGRGLPFPVTNQFNGTMAYATPLILGALAGVMCERSAVTNVSIEGEFLVAAFASALVGTMTGSIPLAVIAGMAVGCLWAALLALFSIKYLVDQVVLGVVLNLLASGITGYLYSQFISVNAAKYNQAPVMSEIAIPGLSNIPFIGPILFKQSPLAYLAFACVLLVWFILYRTKWGLRMRAVGEHPEAADTLGINVRKIRWQAVLIGGLLAGLGGTYFTIGSTGHFVKDISAGNGFIALAALIMGRWKPSLACLMAVFFGFVSQLASQVQTLGTPLNSQFLLILPYIATIVAVAGLVGRVRAPKADGTNFVK